MPQLLGVRHRIAVRDEQVLVPDQIIRIRIARKCQLRRPRCLHRKADSGSHRRRRRAHRRRLVRQEDQEQERDQLRNSDLSA